MNIFSERFKKLREEKRHSRNELAEILGVSTQTIANYENGHREPNFETLKKLADYFNVTTDYLIGRSDFRTWEEERNADNYSFLIRKAEDNLELKKIILDSLGHFQELLDLLFYKKSDSIKIKQEVTQNSKSNTKKEILYQNQKIIHEIILKLLSSRVIFLTHDNVNQIMSIYQKNKYKVLELIDKLFINFLIEFDYFEDKNIHIQNIEDEK